MRFPSLVLIFLLAGDPAFSRCGGSFSEFITTLKAEAKQAGHDPDSVDAFFAPARLDQHVLRADRAQGVFQMPSLIFRGA